MGNDEAAVYGVFVVVLGVVLSFSFCWLCVVILRWVFRINEIVDLLKQIATGEKGAVFRRQSDLKRCVVCEKEYLGGELVKIDSGQLICPECHKMFERKKQVKL